MAFLAHEKISQRCHDNGFQATDAEGKKEVTVGKGISLKF